MDDLYPCWMPLKRPFAVIWSGWNAQELLKEPWGAILNQRLTLEPEYLLRAQKHPEGKRLIGALAASLIEDNDVVFINSGTTTTK